MAGIAAMGDLHLSRAIYSGKFPNMVGDSKFALQQITDHCRESGDDLLLLGDNFDKRYPEADQIADMLSLIRGIDVGFIQGQHCMQRLGWLGIEPSPEGKRIHLHPLTSCEMFGGSISVFGYDYTPRQLLEEALSKVPADCDVLCLHQLNSQVMTLEDQWTLDMSWVPEHVKFVLMGDWHGLPQDGETDGRKWLYTGSSTVRAVGEPRNKSFIRVCRDDGGSIAFTRIPLKTRPYMQTEINWSDDLDKWLDTAVESCDKALDEAIAAGIPEEVAAPFVVVRYDAGITGAFDKIQEVMSKKIAAHTAFVHLMPRSKFSASLQEQADIGMGNQVSVRDIIDQKVDKETEPKLYKLVVELDESSRPKDVVTAFKESEKVTDNPLAIATPTSASEE